MTVVDHPATQPHEGLIESLDSRESVDARVAELIHIPRRPYVQVSVWHPVALKHQANAVSVPLLALSQPDQATNSKDVHRELFIELTPSINLDARNHEHMTGLARLDGEDGKDTVIRPHKATRRTTVQDLGEN